LGGRFRKSVKKATDEVFPFVLSRIRWSESIDTSHMIHNIATLRFCRYLFTINSAELGVSQIQRARNQSWRQDKEMRVYEVLKFHKQRSEHLTFFSQRHPQAVHHVFFLVKSSQDALASSYSYGSAFLWKIECRASQQYISSKGFLLTPITLLACSMY
jgi:hypothetical protein